MVYPVLRGFLKKLILENRLPKHVALGRRRARLFERIAPTSELDPTELALFQMLRSPKRVC
jgi:hypothetical protein